MRTITVSEYGEAQRTYAEAYERGETYQECSVCRLPVVERDANWESWRGTGLIFHQHCVQRGLMMFHAQDWWRLAWDDYHKNVRDMTADGMFSAYGNTASYSALLKRNRREHPGDWFFDRDPDPHRWPGYMELAERCMGLP